MSFFKNKLVEEKDYLLMSFSRYISLICQCTINISLFKHRGKIIVKNSNVTETYKCEKTITVFTVKNIIILCLWLTIKHIYIYIQVYKTMFWLQNLCHQIQNNMTMYYEIKMKIFEKSTYVFPINLATYKYTLLIKHFSV